MGLFLCKRKPNVDDVVDFVEEDPDFCARKFLVPVDESWSSVGDADAIDAIHKGLDLYNPILTRESVGDVKYCLDIQDKISLIYLLYEDSEIETALQYATRLIEGAQLDILDEWIAYVISQGAAWECKLLEALCIIQNYQALLLLGCTKEEINSRFVPTNKFISFYISLIKKKMYRMLEEFEAYKMRIFLDVVKDDFLVNNLQFQRYEYLEMYLLYWTSIKYISTANTSNIERALRHMEINVVAEEVTRNYQINEPTVKAKTKNLKRSSLQASTNGIINCIRENSYHINSDFPGICLIINQENFYTETGSEYMDLAPSIVDKLEMRTGTNIDNNRLISTFKKLNFEIIPKTDLKHFQIREAIESTIESVKNHSSLFICILSHGLKGEIYGVNTKTVEIDSIQEMMCTKNRRNLSGKPKVLILQACQGKKFPEVDDDEKQDCAIDGPPSSTDLYTFYSSPPGFASLRDKRNGSWFIQTLCDKIENHSGDLHFEEICTLVKHEVAMKRFKLGTSTRAMVPMNTSTLTQLFYLPQIDRGK